MIALGGKWEIVQCSEVSVIQNEEVPESKCTRLCL